MPFKDKLKQLFYMRKYQAKRRAEHKKQKQLYVELQEAHVQAIKIMRENLVGRKCMPVRMLPQDAKDAPQEILVPVIHKTFKLGNFETVTRATLEIVAAEDTLLLVGDHKGWPALGIHGLATIPKRNIIQSQGSWPEHFITDVRCAMKTLEGNNNLEPRKLIMNTLASTTNLWHKHVHSDKRIPFPHIMNYYSPFLCNSEGEENNALLIASHETNFQVFMGNDLDISPMLNTKKARLWEALTPVIHKPSSICEITNIKYS